MEKQVFLERVQETLLEKGLSEQTVIRQIDKLSRYIDEEGGEHAETMLDEEDPVLLAEEICTLLRRNTARRRAAEAVTQEEAVVAAVPAEPLAAPTREIDLVPAAGQTLDFVDIPAPSALREQPAEDYAETDNRFHQPESEGFDGQPDDADTRREDVLEVDAVGSRAVEYAGEPGGPLFWVLFCIALPFAAALGLVVLGLFVCGFAALVALMIGSIAALAGVAAIGTAFTLVALVYGIVELLSTLPIGLYEIGIGITVGALVLFTSILLYNFAIRLLPFAMKQLARFFGWTVKRIRLLFIYVKGACAKL